MLLLVLMLLLFLMSSSPGSLRTLPESMFKLPMMAPRIFGPLLQITREFFSINKLLVRGVPSSFEAGGKGVFLKGVAVVGPVVLVVG